MMDTRILVAILGLAAMAVAVPDTVDEFVIESAMGRWYEYSSTPFARATFEANATCGTATYSIINATHINVFNDNRQWYPTGPDDCIDGYAYTTGVTGKLIVQLDGVPFPGDYWVVRLLQRDAEPQYFYMVVTDPDMSTLFVLTRDVAEFEAVYADEMYEWALSEGYDNPIYNLPVRVEHDENCIYPPIPVPECTNDNNNFPTPIPATVY